MPTEQEQRAYNELTAWTLSLRDREFIHQHVVDVWALQHADENSNAIAIPFTLLGLYLHLEEGYTGREVQRVHMKLAQPHGRGPGRKDWPRFPFPKARPAMTVRDVMAVRESERRQAIDAWCQSIWDVWRDSHDAVRTWVRSELGDIQAARARL